MRKGVGNLLCAVAPSMESLIAARALAGIGGGGMSTSLYNKYHCKSVCFADHIREMKLGQQSLVI